MRGCGHVQIQYIIDNRVIYEYIHMYIRVCVRDFDVEPNWLRLGDQLSQAKLIFCIDFDYSFGSNGTNTCTNWFSWYN